MSSIVDVVTNNLANRIISGSSNSVHHHSGPSLSDADKKQKQIYCNNFVNFSLNVISANPISPLPSIMMLAHTYSLNQRISTIGTHQNQQAAL